jgi:hypothetical protein
MAKTNTDLWAWWISPAILIRHEIQPAQPVPVYHVLALWDAAAWNVWDLCLRVPVSPASEPYDDEWYANQYALARALIANPAIISHACTLCRKTLEHPWHPHWSIMDGEQFPWHVPACAWNGSPGAEWTDDFWPPAELN